MMPIYGPTDEVTALLQDIAAAHNVKLVIATDYPAELADEMREPVTEAYEPTAKESEWLGTQIALVFGVCDLTAEQINLDLWQKETEATRKTDYPF